MNKSKILEWLIAEADEKADDHYEEIPDLDVALASLNKWRPVPQPQRLPRSSTRALEMVRETYRDQVTFVSLVMSHYFPRDYFFYRVSKLENEIFDGFAFFADEVAEFHLPFDRVGKKAIDRYLQLNEQLMRFARSTWARSHKQQLHKRLMYFLYEGLGQLFLEREDYNRYWIITSKEEYFDSFDSEKKAVEWSGRKEMKKGDIAFYYRMAPRKAITDVVRVSEKPRFDPWGGWEGFWADFEKVGPIDGIPFGAMRVDRILGKWSVVRRSFQGITAEPVPHSIYNRLLEYIKPKLRKKYGLKPEPVAAARMSGTYRSEEEFEESAVVPLLKSWNLKFRRQYPCVFQFGTQRHVGRVDFYVSDARGPITLFENKLRLFSDQELQTAVAQAKSYALVLGLPSFVVASPEGLWIYAMNKNRENLVEQADWEALKDKQKEDKLRNTLLKLRQ